MRRSAFRLFRKDNSLESAIIEETEWDLLQRKKEILLGNIQDLDFEFKCGKLSDTDYHQVRGEMTADVAVVLEHIEKIEKSLDLDVLIRRETDSRKGSCKTEDSDRLRYRAERKTHHQTNSVRNVEPD